jgi:hypothetical protein
MKFPGTDHRSISESSASPDVTAEVMERLGFQGLDGSSQSIRQARKNHHLKRTAIFSVMFLLILTAAIIERQFSKNGALEAADSGAVSPAQDFSRLNAISALQAPFLRINRSLSAAEEVESPCFQSADDVETEGAPPLQGPILVPGAFGDASASLTSS